MRRAVSRVSSCHLGTVRLADRSVEDEHARGTGATTESELATTQPCSGLEESEAPEGIVETPSHVDSSRAVIGRAPDADGAQVRQHMEHIS